MDIAALSMAISLQNVNNDAGVLMLSKSLDTLEETGDNMVKMMEQSVTPNLGQNIDIYMYKQSY
ncbi:MAG: YjfB family protein [Lachnospiraceae bacterium]|nr:YjfB family protein [Lachnospiraceae bacterium]